MMRTTRPADVVLLRAAALVAGGLARGRYAETASGQTCDPCAATAARWDLTGAVVRAVYEAGGPREFDAPEVRGLLEVVELALRREGEPLPSDPNFDTALHAWSDAAAPGRASEVLVAAAARMRQAVTR